MDLVQGRFAISKVVRDGEVLDIRVVWNSKPNGYNEQVWVPGFMLPTWQDAKNMVCKWLYMPVGQYLAMGLPEQDYELNTGTLHMSDQGDIDVGKMFHNFVIHESDRHALGIIHVQTGTGEGTIEETSFRRFNRLHFGGKGSPFYSYQGQIILLDICKGYRTDFRNPFHWKRVYCNFPASITYDASMPRLMKLWEDEELACGEIAFVDDIHVSGRRIGGLIVTRRGCKRLKARMNYLGNQADDQKYRDLMLTLGPWNGGIIHTDTPFPMESTMGEKWDKFRQGLQLIVAHAKEHDEFETVSLRRIAGLGVNITEIYPEGRPYFKGAFNALEAWRG